MLLPAYKPARWLLGAHAQTIYPALCLKPAAPKYKREIWHSPDGDELALDRLVSHAPPSSPLLVHFHGLEGSSHSHYARALMNAVLEHGWQGLVVHFRSCGGHRNQRPRAYHAGDEQEIDWIMRKLRGQTQGKIYAAGVSLGGNALAKWLGSQGQHCLGLLDASAIISAPLDLLSAGKVLDEGLNRLIYTRPFLKTLKPKTHAQFQRFPRELAELGINPQKLSNVHSLREFDDHITAPMHGFAGVDDYWRRASSKPGLANIAIPSLLINARNDPFLPAHALPTQREVSPAVTLLQPAHGGHVGFVEGGFPGRIDWLPRCLITYFEAH